MCVCNIKLKMFSDEFVLFFDSITITVLLIISSRQ